MKYALHPESAEELREAAAYYKKRAGTALSLALLNEFEHCMGLLMRYPMLGASWVLGQRRLLMKHFPYAIVYVVAEEEIRVLAIAHHRRRPTYWRKRTWLP